MRYIGLVDFLKAWVKLIGFAGITSFTYTERLYEDTADLSDLRLEARHLEALDMIENAESLKSILELK